MFEWIRKKMSKISPFKEAGVSGTAVFGGYVENNEKNPKLANGERWRTAADMLANISIIAAGVRYYLNLVAKPAWIAEPVDETPAAQEYADFLTSVMNGMDAGWVKAVRQGALHKYHGFAIMEWTAKRRDDGMIGIGSIEPRPSHTIERWDIDESGNILGVWQRSPQTGRELEIPRHKMLYFVDDMLSDSPEGMGWFRHLAEPAERLKAYLNLEAIGFERDLSGIPIGRAPIAAINKAVKNGELTQAQANNAISGITKFVQQEVKKKNTGLVLDSQHFTDTTADGPKNSAVAQWGIELLTGSAGSMPQLAAAIDRLRVEMAQIIGVEGLLIGTNGTGSLALSEDKSDNLYMQVNSTLTDMAEQMNKDFVDTVWALNGLPEDMKPRLKVEELSFRDAAMVAEALAKMAQAGAVLAPDDEAVNDLRDMLGLSRIERVDAE